MIIKVSILSGDTMINNGPLTGGTRRRRRGPAKPQFDRQILALLAVTKVAADWSALIVSAGSFVSPSCLISCRLLTSGPLVCPPCPIFCDAFSVSFIYDSYNIPEVETPHPHTN